MSTTNYGRMRPPARCEQFSIVAKLRDGLMVGGWMVHVQRDYYSYAIENSSPLVVNHFNGFFCRRAGDT